MNTSTISAQIWQQHSEKLKKFICSKVDGEDHCQDILHDVFLKITEKEERIKLIEQPASYLIKMAQNIIIDYYRTQKKTISLSQQEEVITAETLSDIQLADCCLLSFIKKLPPAYSEALILTELKGVSQKELARKLKPFLYRYKIKSSESKKNAERSNLSLLPLSVRQIWKYYWLL